MQDAPPLRILYLTSFFPYPPHGGGKLRVANIIQRLSARHEVHLLALGWSERDLGAEARELALRHCTGVTVVPHRLSRVAAGLESLVTGRPYELNLLWSRPFRDAVRQAVRELEPDVIWCSRIAALQHLSGEEEGLKILDQHDLASYQWDLVSRGSDSAATRLYALLNRSLARRLERKLFRRIDLSISTSERERRMTAELAPADLPRLTAPNGVDLDEFAPADPEAEHESVDEPSLVLVGQMNAMKNVDAAIFFARTIFPAVRARHPEVTFYVVGGNPVPQVKALAKIPGVVVTGWVPDVRPYIERATAVVAPHRMGSGVKHKIPIAMAMRKAIVTTTSGCHGIDLRDGEHALVADDPAGFAEAVDRVLSDPDLRRRLARQARELAVERYDWDRIVAGLEDELFEARRRALAT